MPRPHRKPLRSAAHIELTEQLVAERKKRGFSQTYFGQLIGWSQSDVSKVENGERRLDVIEFVNWANALEINAADLVTSLQSIASKTD